MEGKVKNYTELTSSPWRDIRISVLASVRGKAPFVDLFYKFLQSLIDTCSDSSIVEMLIKIDSEENYKPFHTTMTNSPFRFKILCYPKYNSRLNTQHFNTDLCKIASGDILWHCYDELVVTKGDWVQSLLKTRDVYPDNIYAARLSSFRSYPAKPTIKNAPNWAVSKEWFNILGNWCNFPNSDRWNFIMAHSLARQIDIHDIDILRVHPNGTPYSAGSPFLTACAAKASGYYTGEIKHIFDSQAIDRETLLKEWRSQQ